MSGEPSVLFENGSVFDGTDIHDGHTLVLEDGRIKALQPSSEPAPPDASTRIDLEGDILCPGFVDVQVNGGGGVLFNDDPSVATMQRIAAAHLPAGTTSILPTLITDTPERTAAAVDAAVAAAAADVPGIAGLHLEGPHLSRARKGAHDPSLIRPMGNADLDLLCDAAKRLPALMVTVAPESVTKAQVSALVSCGAVVSLGHSDADYETCMAYAEAGASCVTHLFNAMSQLGNRAPGLVGAALDNEALSAGLIADGIHVHPATIRSALAAKAGKNRVFLVSDAMAPAGTDQNAFLLNGRKVLRSEGRLVLEDGTLAGADLTMAQAASVLHTACGVDLATTLAMCTSIPARVARLPDDIGTLRVGQKPYLVRLSVSARGLSVRAVYSQDDLRALH